MVYRESFSRIFKGLISPDMLTLFMLLIAILGVGTAFYTLEEGWSIVDSFYFSAMTVTTAGFGDLHPSSDTSKLFIVFYIFTGLGVVLAFVQTLVQRSKHDSIIGKILHHEDKEQE